VGIRYKELIIYFIVLNTISFVFFFFFFGGGKYKVLISSALLCARIKFPRYASRRCALALGLFQGVSGREDHGHFVLLL
jgi:hypothetical protein